MLAAMPALAFLAFVPEAPIVGTAVPAIGVIAALLAASEWVRGRGLQVERRLEAEWGGSTTTRALRHDGDHPELRSRRRNAISALADTELPSALEDEHSESAATYRAAVRAALSVIRRDALDSALLASENASYGFRRNMRGIRSQALVVVLLCGASHVALTIFTGAVIGAVVIAADAILSAYWIFVVRDAWVREQAEQFADTFFNVAMVATSRRGTPTPES